MSNVKVGDFARHIHLGGLVHVERALKVDATQDTLWEVTAISPMPAANQYVEGAFGLRYEFTGKPEVASPGSCLASWDSMLRRVDPPPEEDCDAETLADFPRLAQKLGLA